MCGDLNVNGLQRLMYLDIWPLVGRTIWEGVEGVALFKEVCHWG